MSTQWYDLKQDLNLNRHTREKKHYLPHPCLKGNNDLPSFLLRTIQIQLSEDTIKELENRRKETEKKQSERTDFHMNEIKKIRKEMEVLRVEKQDALAETKKLSKTVQDLEVPPCSFFLCCLYLHRGMFSLEVILRIFSKYRQNFRYTMIDRIFNTDIFLSSVVALMNCKAMRLCRDGLKFKFCTNLHISIS